MAQYDYIRIKPETKEKWNKAKLKEEFEQEQSFTHDEFAQIVLHQFKNADKSKKTEVEI